MLYEIINPSDKMTMAAENQGVAACAIILLGEGWYGLDPHTGNEDDEVPLFITDEWFEDRFDMSSVDYMRLHWDEVVAALETVTYGGFDDYREYHDQLEKLDEDKREDFAFRWAGEHRTSMNNIGERAKQLAVVLKARSSRDTLWAVNE